MSLDLLESPFDGRSLIEASAAIVWTANPEGSLHRRQTAWMRFTGQDEAAYAGLGFLDAIHPDDRAHTRAAWTRAVASLEPYATEHRMRAASGAYRHMSVRAVPILEPDGTLREWVGTHTDITERKETELRLERLAMSDALTGLANRAHFVAAVSQATASPNHRGLSAVLLLARRYARGPGGLGSEAEEAVQGTTPTGEHPGDDPQQSDRRAVAHTRDLGDHRAGSAIRQQAK